LLGEAEQPESPEIVAWSFRKLLEAVAESEPLVAVLDDLQWAESTLLDLVEHVADLSRDAPILLLCLARPDLLDRRPGWGGGKLNATAVLLEPLPTEECERLIDGLLYGSPLGDDVRSRILAAADGNPLFVDEMLALIREGDGHGEVEVPRSIQALLAARLDQLDPSERGVLERGSVEGKVFHRGAVQALAPDETEVPARLVALVRKELLRPDRTQLRGDDAYRFRHLLIRDAAYEALPKSTRADLHQRFADWLEEHGADLVELDEILGYHLEQAHRYRTELGPADERAEHLAARAVVRLAEAAERAGARGDLPAKTSLLRRSVAIAPDDAGAARRRLEYADSLYHSGDAERAATEAEAVLRLAATEGDRSAELLARMLLAEERYWAGAENAAPELEAIAAEAIPIFERVGDHEGLFAAWRAVGQVEWLRCRQAECLAAKKRALEHARRTGRSDVERNALIEIGVSLVLGPTPAEEALAWYDEHRWLEPMRPMLGANRGRLLGMLGRFGAGREAIELAIERMRELGNEFSVAHACTECAFELELLAGNPVEAERWAQTGCGIVERFGRPGVLSTYAGYLARALLAVEKNGEAEEWSNTSEALGASDDISTQVLWRQARARVLARRAEHEAARVLAEQAVALADTTDHLIQRGDALADLAEVLELAGDANGATAALERALAEYEQKGVVPAIERTRARLAALRAPA
jgi:hypothetical protein